MRKLVGKIANDKARRLKLNRHDPIIGTSDLYSVGLQHLAKIADRVDLSNEGHVAFVYRHVKTVIDRFVDREFKRRAAISSKVKKAAKDDTYSAISYTKDFSASDDSAYSAPFFRERFKGVDINSIYEIIANLPDRLRLIFLERVFTDKTFEEIGSMFTITTNAARHTYKRALKKIKEGVYNSGG